MKINIEVELDFIEEGGSLDGAIKDAIVSNVEKRVVAELQKTVLAEARAKLEGAAARLCVEEVQKRIGQLLDAPRTVTDSYGRVIKDGLRLEDLLIKQVDDALTLKTLNGNGSRADSYDAKYSTIEWFCKKTIDESIDKQVKLAMEEAHQRIKTLVHDKVKAGVADKLTDLIVNNSSALALKA